MLLLDDQDRVLLGWRHRFVPDRWGWELPGGAVDEVEQPGEAAVRELEDQTGYDAGRVEHLISFQALAGTADAKHAVFVGHDPKQIGEPTVMDEVVRAEWVPLRSVPALIASAQIWNAASLVALLQLLALSGQPESH